MKTTNMTKSVVALAGAALACSASLQGGALVYEGFNYGGSGFYEPQNAANGPSGFGWSDTAWNQGNKNGIDQTATSAQSYGSLAVKGSGITSAADLWGNRGRLLDSSLSDAGLLDNGATLWFSVLVKNTGGADKLGFSLSNGNFSSSNQWGMDGGVSGIGVFAENGGQAKAAMWTPGALDVSLDSGAYFDISSTTLIVGKIEWGAEFANETLTLYTPDAALNQGAAVSTNSIADMNQSTFNRISLLVKEGGYMDEIRLGATYEDVIVVP
jgi:hypothetical protein